MKWLSVLALVVGLTGYAAGVSDDYHVEQVVAPGFVSPIDLGTHMTSRHTRAQALHGDMQPYSTSSKHEVQEEQRFVNGQPVYEKRHERRYQDGRLVHEDGHVKGHPDRAVVLPGVASGYGSGYEASSSGYTSGGSGYGTGGSGYISGSSGYGTGGSGYTSGSTGYGTGGSGYTSGSSGYGTGGSGYTSGGTGYGTSGGGYVTGGSGYGTGGVGYTSGGTGYGTGGSGYTTGGSGHGTGGSSYRSSSSSSHYQSTGGAPNAAPYSGVGREGSTVNVAGGYGDTASGYGDSRGSYGSSSRSSLLSHTSDDLANNLHTDVERLRQRLHQGAAVIRTPAARASQHEEKREESHFVDGQQVYHRNEERRYEDGRLVHNVTEEKGAVQPGSHSNTDTRLNALSSQQGRKYESSTQQQHISRGSEYGPSETSYRASSWRPGRVSTTSQRQTSQVSTMHQPVAGTSTSNLNVESTSRTPYQSSYRTTSNRVRPEVNKPAYRASYTPSSTVERVPQASVVAMRPQIASSSSTNRQYSHSDHRPTTETITTRPISSAVISENSEYQMSYSNKPYPAHTGSAYDQSYGSESSVEGSPVSYQPSSHTSSTATRQQFSTSYGSGSYVRPTESPASDRTTSRITDTYSVPYSLRSPSYQPSRFANYSAWSHWKKEAGELQPSSTGTLTSQSQYNNENAYSGQTVDTLGSASSQSQYNANAYSGQIDDRQDTNHYPSASSHALHSRQSQHVRTFRPGFLYDEHENYGNDIDEDDSSLSNNDNLEENENTLNYRPSSSSSYSSGSEHSSSQTVASNTPRSTDAVVEARPGSKVDLSITVDVGDGESVRLGGVSRTASHEDEQDRYDISPIVDGGSDSIAATNEVDTDYARRSSLSRGEQSHAVAEAGDDDDYRSNRVSTYRQENVATGYTGSLYPQESLGSSFDQTTRVTNRTKSTITSQIQPLVSSYKLETRTQRRYLNGMLVSETKFNRYYENGILVHENQTERSRDEMVTAGIDVASFDLSASDLVKYGVLQSGAQPSAHTQRFEMKQEKEFVDGNQIYEATHERHFQDGELVHEDHDEKDRDDLMELERNSGNSGTTRQVSSGGAYTSNFIENRNYGSSYDTGTYGGPTRSGHRQKTDVGETVTVSVSPVTRTRKTEVRQEQEYRDGEQVYDLRHERHFDDGRLVHEDLSEKGPDELGAPVNHDALQDILSGRTLATASHSAYRPSSAVAARTRNTSSHYQDGSYSYDRSGNALTGGNEDYEYTRASNRAYDSGHEVDRASHYEASAGSQQTQDSRGLVGTNLLTSGCLSCVIGGDGIQRYDTLNNAPSLSTGSSSLSSRSTSSSNTVLSGSSQPAAGAGYYTVHGGSGSGYGGVRSSDSSSSGYSSETSSAHGSAAARPGSSAGGYFAVGSFGADASGYGSVQPATHRREMEVEEHYENGQLVSGRSEDSEWKDNNLVKHQERRYGEGEQRTHPSTSQLTSPALTSSTSYQTSGSSSQTASTYGASASFGAHTGDFEGQQGRAQEAYSGGFDGQRTGSQGAYSGGYDGQRTGAQGAYSRSFEGQSAGAFRTTGTVPHGFGGGVTHRREMEVEEHYENGQLVRGREEDKEWKNDQLLKHEHRTYGEGNAGSPSAAAHTSAASRSVFQNSLTGECSNEPCGNGGSCITGQKGYLCVCTFGFRGPACQEAYCPTRYCRHDGLCHVDDTGLHTCSCPVQYTGPRCEHRARDRGAN